MLNNALTESLVVYGTLKRGHPNHHWLLDAHYQGVVRLEGMALYDLGPFPMAIRGSGELIGELYRLDADTLAAIDRFEGAPRLYQRLRCQPVGGPWSWVYLGSFRQVRHSPRLVSGVWSGTRRLRRQDELPLDAADQAP